MAHTANALPPCAPFVSGATLILSPNVPQTACGTIPILPSANGSFVSCSSEAATSRFVSIGKEVEVVHLACTTNDTYAPDVSRSPTELKTALEHRHSHPVCPYNVLAWEALLEEHGLRERYHKITNGFRFGFDLDLPHILVSQIPINSPSLAEHSKALDDIIDRELLAGRYIGPFTRSDLQSLVGPFQTSPVSIIPKSGKPGRFRVIQNFSFPHSPSPHAPQPSINSMVISDNFPCTWGTFDTVCSIIRHLPAGSQAATRDVAEAYRTIPLLPAQWPATVVRSDLDSFYVDTCTSFGMGPSAGAYGYVADAGADLFCALGLGPLTKWVDDHLFFRIRCEDLSAYNSYRDSVRQHLSTCGMRQTGGRIWFEGDTFEDGTCEVFSEDHRFPLRDFSTVSNRTPEDQPFSSSFADIDESSINLGIPWEITKDTQFAYTVLFIGLLWNLTRLIIALADAKREKYLAAIARWLERPTHVLLEMQQLYGKLLHACLVLPRGRAYLTSLESMLSIASSRPFVPYHSVRHLNEDLVWWTEQLSCPSLHRIIPQPFSIIDIHAFSDASSGVGIGVVIKGFWRAWSLRRDWQSLNGAKDIGWAKAVGFELLILCIVCLGIPSAGGHFRLHCDNLGVVEGWKNGRSQNWATNCVFRRILSMLEPLGPHTSFHLSYVPSASNPADGPSRGRFPPTSMLLPPIILPSALQDFVHDEFNTLSSSSCSHPQRHSSTFSVDDRPERWDYGEELLWFRESWSD